MFETEIEPGVTHIPSWVVDGPGQTINCRCSLIDPRDALAIDSYVVKTIEENKMSLLTKKFAEECREEVNYYRGRAVEAKRDGLTYSRRTMIECALINRANARKWANA